jgi:hypothetical protein
MAASVWIGDGDARIGCGIGGIVLLCRHGGAGTGHAPAAHDPDHRESGAGGPRYELEALYRGTGRQSIAPERLLRASLLQAFYTVRSERQLMAQINYNLLFRWFVGLGIDDAVWDHSTFSKNRDRLLVRQKACLERNLSGDQLEKTFKNGSLSMKLRTFRR